MKIEWAAAAAVLAVVASPVLADKPQQPQPLGVWDSQGGFVGNYITDGRFQTVIDGKIMTLPYQADKIPNGVVKYVYTQPNCTGQVYIQHDLSETLLAGFVLNGVIY